jgi:hypothetical protein
MEILNRNNFTEEEVTFKNIKKGDNKSDFTLIYIGKSCFALHDLEKVVNFAKKKDLNESLNYRVKNYIK